MFGVEIKFSGNAYEAYEELFEQIEPHIEKMISSNQSKFMGILYRIDVSELKLKQEMAKVEAHKYSEVVTRLVLQKELQKVIIRNIYSTKNDITN